METMEIKNVELSGTEPILTPIKYKKLTDIAKEPTRGSAAAAGYDLYAATNDATRDTTVHLRKASAGLRRSE